MSTQTFIILTTGEGNLKELATMLKEIGFTGISILGELGQIIGKGTEAMQEKARKLKGVSDVLPSHEDIDIGLPGDVTW